MVVVGVVGVLAVVVGALVVVRSGGGSDSEGDSGGSGRDGWVVGELGNSQLLSASDELVCSTATGSAYCVEAGSGEERFSVSLDRGLASSPVLLDDRIVVASSGAFSGSLIAYSLDGEELWDESLEVDAERDLPVVGGVVTVVDGEELVGVSVADGAEVWRNYVPADNQDGELGDVEGPRADGPDVFTDGTSVYAAIETIDRESGDASGNVVAVDPATGEEVWRSEVLGDIGFGSGITDVAPFEDGSAVAFLMEGTPRRVIALDAATGQLRWEFPVATPYADLADIGGTTVVADGPDMRALDRNGRPVWEVPSPVIERSPSLLGPGELVVDQGRLFIAGVDVLEVDPATGASEMLRADVNATDVAIAADLLVLAGIGELQAVPLSPGDGD